MCDTIDIMEHELYIEYPSLLRLVLTGSARLTREMFSSPQITEKLYIMFAILTYIHKPVYTGDLPGMEY